jgi:hypothetical protein
MWFLQSSRATEQEQAEQLCQRKGLQGIHVSLHVTKLLESWPEQITHGRRWVSRYSMQNLIFF